MPHPTVLTSSAFLVCVLAAPATQAQSYVATQDYVTTQGYVPAPGYAVTQEYVTTREPVTTGSRQIVGSRCADFGADFIDMGNGVCGRVGTTARVQLGTRSAGLNEWTSSPATSATLRSEGLLPGAAVQHLRVHGYAPASPFQ